MPRTLLLCFIHGYRGDDDTFITFPEDLKSQVAEKLPDHQVATAVYPKYATKGELSKCTGAFLDWLKERVMELRKSTSEKAWPPDRDVGVIIVAHSMGGFVASDTLFLTLNERAAQNQEGSPPFPLIQGLLTFDCPFNGLARPMFVYGAFSNYSKVSSVFNVMTALSAAPAGLSQMAFNRSTSTVPAHKTSTAAWKSWQLVAMRTGTVGAIAAGGVAAYMNRQRIVEGLRSINKDSMMEGYQQGLDAVGQGLAYINKGSVGKSFEYLSDHFTFVGSLMKQNELNNRLDRLATLNGVGIRNFYTSLGPNGTWTGGYFVPERTFCAVPSQDHIAYPLFSRQVVRKVDDEVQAHVSMFKRDKNLEYSRMMDQASDLVVIWFSDETEVTEDPKYANVAPTEDEQPIHTTEDGKEIQQPLVGEDDSDELPDESPLDIAAASNLAPFPDDNITAPDTIVTKESPKSSYMIYLMRIAQQAGTGIKPYVPTQVPQLPTIPKPGLPSLPRVNVFGSKKTLSDQNTDEASAKPNSDGKGDEKDIEPEPGLEQNTANVDQGETTAEQGENFVTSEAPAANSSTMLKSFVPRRLPQMPSLPTVFTRKPSEAQEAAASSSQKDTTPTIAPEA